MGNKKKSKSKSSLSNLTPSNASVFTPHPSPEPQDGISPVPNMIVQQSIPMSILPQNQLDMLVYTKNKILEEKNELEARLTSLLNEAQESNIRIKQKDIELKLKDREIDELRRANEILKAQITELEALIKTLQSDMLQQQQQMGLVIKQLRRIEVQTEYEKFVIALQDLNSHYKLESHVALPSTVRKKMYSLRNARISPFHYILECDDPAVIQYKEFKVLTKLQVDMSSECKMLFQKTYGKEFISEIINCVSSIGAHVSIPVIPDDERTEADDWWSDL